MVGKISREGTLAAPADPRATPSPLGGRRLAGSRARARRGAWPRRQAARAGGAVRGLGLGALAVAAARQQRTSSTHSLPRSALRAHPRTRGLCPVSRV